MSKSTQNVHDSKVKPLTETDEYVLGTHDEELARLGFQHQLWRSQAGNLWERAGFRRNQQILDLGCGPGFATLDLANLAGSKGKIHSVDISAKFIEHLNAVIDRLGISNIKTYLQNIEQLDLPPSSIDNVFTRWVFCFVADPEEIIRRVGKVLRKGGRFAIQDYYFYLSIRLSPVSQVFQRVTLATNESWKVNGGDPDIGMRLPELLARNGFKIIETKPIVRSARPGDLLWDWPGTFFKIFIPALIKMGLLDATDEIAFEKDWADHSANPAAFFTTPLVLDIIAEKQ